ncbi:OsmC family protein [Desulfovibrio legallii]|jgi:uncharacterized OsmC-like protein|uniref:Uncharacterized OsmC-related protein n=1 Tax=Desulfovibrio legallii TaxID=571438 RepID=A0A1G7NYE5_9BACT|nr:OsmC family protein [Desulfovibrio legallii]SDF78379.1 Uncharacterized OsmC-related protein [Desulfovibrio legallii]
MATVTETYLGNLRVECVHTLSGTKLCTTPTPDHGGAGDSFSPTDLCAAALGACALSVLATYAENHGLDVSGTRLEINKSMTSGSPSRIGRLEVTFHMPARPYSQKEKTVMERAAKTCGVHHSLHPDVEQVFIFDWPDAAPGAA